MKDRIKELRQSLNLTQQSFADRIGIKRGAIANYEIGRNEPTDSVVSLICREFRVNEAWLRTGEGEMFLPATNSALEAMVEERGLPRSVTVLVEQFLDLDPRIQQGILDYMQNVVDAINSEQEELERDELHRELDRQLDLEEGIKRSGAS